MSSHFAKPENALRKAKDLIRVGNDQEALQCLHAILINKRYRTFQATHEKIAMLYVNLGVKLSRNIKDALVQYRIICGVTNVHSLELVRVLLAVGRAFVLLSCLSR